MARVISAEELKNKMDANEQFILVDTLNPNSFALKHLPGAINIPNGPQFLEQFEQQTGAAKDAEIITYCSANTCSASVEAARMLEEAGYTNVAHYKDGLVGWDEAGFAFE